MQVGKQKHEAGVYMFIYWTEEVSHEKYELMCLQYIPLKLGTDACVATVCR